MGEFEIGALVVHARDRETVGFGGRQDHGFRRERARCDLADDLLQQGIGRRRRAGAVRIGARASTYQGDGVVQDRAHHTGDDGGQDQLTELTHWIGIGRIGEGRDLAAFNRRHQHFIGAHLHVTKDTGAAAGQALAYPVPIVL